MSLKEKAMLVHLKISKWTARKYDKDLSFDVLKQHNMDADAGRFNKHLVNKAYLRPIESVTKRLRDEHYDRTLPWLNDQSRLLPSKGYMDYVRAIGDLQNEFDAAVSTFISQYPKVLEEARTRMGDTFSAQEYPDTGDLNHKFGITTTMFPLPNEEDFRIVAVEDSVRKQLEHDAVANIAKAHEHAKKALVDRFRFVCTELYEKLADPDKKLYSTIFDKLRTLVDLAPELNYTNDSVISVVIDEAEVLLAKYDFVGTLRENKDFRAEAADGLKTFIRTL